MVWLYEQFINPLNTYIRPDKLQSTCAYSCTYKNIDTSFLFSCFLPFFYTSNVEVIRWETCPLHAEYQDKIKSYQREASHLHREYYSIASLLNAPSGYNHELSHTGGSQINV